MEMLAIIEAHCRFAAGQLPRGQGGCATALRVLAALPGACARGLPDVTCGTPGLFVALVRFGLLEALPSRRVRLAAIRLLARVTPMVEQRSPRQWSLWFALALDPMSAPAQRLQAMTSASQRAVRDPGETFSPPRARDHRRERGELVEAARVARAEADEAREAVARAAVASDSMRARVVELEGQIEEVRREGERRLVVARAEYADELRQQREVDGAKLTASREVQLRALDALRREHEAERVELMALREGARVHRKELERLGAAREADRQALARAQEEAAQAERKDAALEAASARLLGAARELMDRDAQLREAGAKIEELEQMLNTARIDRAAAVRAREEAGKQMANLRAETKRFGEEASARLATILERDRQLAAVTGRCDESTAECRRLREAVKKEEALRRGAEEQHRELWGKCEQLSEQHEVAEKKVLAMRDAFMRRTAEALVWKSYAPSVADAVIQQQVDRYLAQHKASR